jgi:hypothetical protein
MSVSPTPALGAICSVASHLDVLAGKRGADIAGRNILRALALRLRIDPDDLDLLGAAQDRQSIECGPGGLAPAIPRHQHSLADARVHSCIRHDQDGAAALHGEAIGDVEPRRPRPLGVGLAGDDKIGGVRLWQDAVGDAEGAGVVLAPLGHQAATARGLHERRLHGGVVLGAIEFAVGIDDDGRAERGPGRDDRHRRHHRQPDQVRLEGLR